MYTGVFNDLLTPVSSPFSLLDCQVPVESRETRMQHNRTSNSKAESQSGDSIYLALRAVMEMEHREQDGLQQQGLPESHSPRSRHPPGLYAATARSFGQPFWTLFSESGPDGRSVGASI